MVTSTLPARVLDTLRDAAISSIEFSIGAIDVTPHGFEHVSRLVRSCRIDAKWHTELQGRRYAQLENSGVYLADEDLLVIRKDPFWQRSIVHECVHAMVDAMGPPRVYASFEEAAAYLAQVIFERRRGRAVPFEPNSIEDLADRVVWANDLFAPPSSRPNRRNRDRLTLGDEGVSDLINAIRRSYRLQPNSVYVNNGIRRRSRCQHRTH